LDGLKGMSEIRGLDAWMSCLVDRELPTLNAVVRDICEASQNELSRADDLTKIILRDANLTSRVLKVANSVHYNTAFEPIKTVSRAIVRLGFENLKTITLASSVIETFLKGKPQEELIKSMARAFHAAVQARAMVANLDAENREQVFIAALLRNIAELALLSTGKPVVTAFIDARNLHPEQERSLSLEYLGTDLLSLNQQLIKDWSLGDLIMEATEARTNPSIRARAVALGNELSKQIYKGMQNPGVINLCEQVSRLCKISVDEAKKQVMLKADEASVIAKNYGADILISALPDPSHLKETIKEEEDDIEEELSDYAFQQHLNKLHQLMLSSNNISETTQAALLALYEGSLIPRCCICVIDYKTKTLDVRYVAGKGTHIWRQQIKITLEHLHKGELLHDILLNQKPLWHKSKYVKDIGQLQLFEAKGDIFLAPLQHNKRLLAIVYADAIDGHFNAKQYEEFQLIANQLILMMRLNAGSV
jgi:HD-like signal output (HDOD) protein